MLECDYPRSGFTWPGTIGNASRVCNLTPADPATVAA
jgi:hypothetical protein